MPRGKNTNIWFTCLTKGCKHPMRYTRRLNKKNIKKIETNKYCPVCRKHTAHVSKDITSKGSTKATRK